MQLVVIVLTEHMRVLVQDRESGPESGEAVSVSIILTSKRFNAKCYAMCTMLCALCDAIHASCDGCIV